MAPSMTSSTPAAAGAAPRHPLYICMAPTFDEKATALRVASPELRSAIIREKAKLCDIDWLRAALTIGCFDLKAEFDATGDLDVSPGCIKAVAYVLQTGRSVLVKGWSKNDPLAEPFPALWLNPSDEMQGFVRDLVAHVIGGARQVDAQARIQDPALGENNKLRIETTMGWLLATACAQNLPDSARDLLSAFPACATTWIPATVMGQQLASHCRERIKEITPYFVSMHLTRSNCMAVIEEMSTPYALMMAKDEKSTVHDVVSLLQIYTPACIPLALTKALLALRTTGKMDGLIEDPSSRFDPVIVSGEDALATHARMALRRDRGFEDVMDRYIPAFLDAGVYERDAVRSLDIAIQHARPGIVARLAAGEVLEQAITDGSLRSAVLAALSRAKDMLGKVQRTAAEDALLALHAASEAAGAEARLIKAYTATGVTNEITEPSALASIVNFGFIRLLVRHLDNGMDPSTPLVAGQSILELAASSGQADMADTIRSYSARTAAMRLIENSSSLARIPTRD